VLRDPTFQPHQAGVAEQVRADLALFKRREVNAVDPVSCCFVSLALLWQNLAIDWRNWIPESDFQ
jgi:hypothetical protein